MSLALAEMPEVRQDLRPVYADIGIIESCNLRCEMCKMYEIKFPRREDFVPLEKWDSFFADMRQIAGQDFIFNLPGGEPLLHPQIFDIVKIASSHGLRPLLSTNGYLITNAVAERLIASGLFAATISLDSSVPEIHDRIRGVRGTFKRVERAIRLLDFYSRVYRGRKFNTGIQGVVSRMSLHTVPELVKWAEDNVHVDRINLNLLMQPNNTAPSEDWYIDEFSHLWPDADEAERVFCRLIGERRKGRLTKLLNSDTQLESYKKYFRNPKATPKMVKCSYDRAICTNSSGDVHLCYYHDSIGNIKTNRLSDIWKSEKAQAVRKRIGNCSITHCWFRLNCLYTE